MNFHETKMGSIFFNSQLPQLTRALQEIASALSKPAPAIKLDDTADPELLHNLFYALYEPGIYGNRESISPLDHNVRQTEAALMPTLGQSQELFEQYQAAVSERDDAMALRAFCSGYRAGIQMMLCGISTPQTVMKGSTPDGQ